MTTSKNTTKTAAATPTAADMDIERFLKSKFTPRSEFIPLPMLSQYFPEGCDRIGVEVVGLDGIEYSRIQAGGRKELQRLAFDLLSAQGGDLAEAVKKYLGVGESPEYIEKMICLLEAGIVYPVLKPDQKLRFAAKLCRAFPTQFTQIANRIMELTGAGQQPEG